MPILHAVILGVVQGLTEFLPVSSSGHLAVVPWLFGWQELVERPEVDRSLAVALHVGTFLGAVAYFRADIARLAAGGLRSLRAGRAYESDERLPWLLLLSALPAAVVGLALDTLVEDVPLEVVGALLVVFGLVLLAADRRPEQRGSGDFRLRDALLMGAAQAVALLPGVSRSGVTISAGRCLRLERGDATRISFLMALPVIGGAGLYEGVKLATSGLPPGFAPAFAWGVATSAVTGFAAVWGLLRLVRTMSFLPFVAYRVVAGLAVIGLGLAR